MVVISPSPLLRQYTYIRTIQHGGQTYVCAKDLAEHFQVLDRSEWTWKMMFRYLMQWSGPTETKEMVIRVVSQPKSRVPRRFARFYAHRQQAGAGRMEPVQQPARYARAGDR